MGVAFAWGATNYNVGDAARMGPGYFPLLLGSVMALIGVLIIINALVVKSVDGDKIGPWAWRPLFYIIAANFVFRCFARLTPRRAQPLWATTFS